LDSDPNKEELDELRVRHDEVIAERDLLLAEIKQLKELLAALEIDKSGYGEDIIKLEEKIVEKEDSLKEITDNLLNATNKMEIYKTELSTRTENYNILNENYTTVQDKVDELDSDNGSLFMQRNIFGGSFAGSMIFGVLYWWLKRRRGNINSLVESGKDRIAERAEDIRDSVLEGVNDRVDEIEKKITGKKNNPSIDAIQEYITSTIKSHTDKVYQSFEQKVDELQEGLLNTAEEKLEEKKPIGKDDDEDERVRALLKLVELSTILLMLVMFIACLLVQE